MGRLSIGATTSTRDFSARRPQNGNIIIRMSVTDADGVAYQGLSVENLKILAIVEDPAGGAPFTDTVFIDSMQEWQDAVRGVYDVTLSHPHMEPPTVGGWFRRRHTLVLSIQKSPEHGQAVFSIDLTNIDSA
jgi:hypothetical protein